MIESQTIQYLHRSRSSSSDAKAIKHPCSRSKRGYSCSRSNEGDKLPLVYALCRLTIPRLACIPAEAANPLEPPTPLSALDLRSSSKSYARLDFEDCLGRHGRRYRSQPAVTRHCARCKTVRCHTRNASQRSILTQHKEIFPTHQDLYRKISHLHAVGYEP